MIEETLREGLGQLSEHGTLVVHTGRYTGRVARQRYLVRRPESAANIGWSAVNQPIDPEFAARLFAALEEKLSERESFAFQGGIGGRLLELVSDRPWYIAFAENMFREDPSPWPGPGARREVSIRILHDPCGSVPKLGLGLAPDPLIVIDPVDARVAIVGTRYAGEIKKAAFSLCNHSLPDAGILPMHASANCLADGSRTCLLFGLSGTGKTTLSASPDRYLIGDDEIVWTLGGISNLEAGCYAKLIDLSEEREPEIFRAVNSFGAIAENVVLSPVSRRIDFASRVLTENTRGSYPIESYERAYRQDREAAAPVAIVFLVADAFGALPAVAQLDPWQAQYHFISGYSAKLAGTETGVASPEATFSACFGEPFMPRPASVYAHLLARNAQECGATFWLLNTGWTHGGYGRGMRFPLAVTRRILAQIQSGELRRRPATLHPVFGFRVPAFCDGVEPAWLGIPEGGHVERLAAAFHENFVRHAADLDPRVEAFGGPDTSGFKRHRVGDAA